MPADSQLIERRLPPELSARTTFGKQSLVRMTLVAAAVIAAVVTWPRYGLPVLTGALALCYLAMTLDRQWLVIRGMRGWAPVTVDDDEALALSDEHLPVYTVLLPVYDEPDIVQNLIQGVGKLDYPANKLEVLLLVEEDDPKTLTALEGIATEKIRVVIVPHSLPKTKPKACNHGMSLPDIRGELMTIYDAEDLPDPLQLRRAVAAFRRLPTDVGCLQGRLSFYNERQNLLTRWFSLEYSQWFGLILPAVEAAHCVVPLGGTSNHMPTAIWREVGGWDEFNVTEDADLGVRLARSGYRTMILDSVTLEEATTDVINWIRQRSRWYKGYLQTMVVHLRQPVALVREIGLLATLRLIGMTGCVPISSALNIPFGFLLLIWITGRPEFVNMLFPPVTYFICMTLFLLGAPLSVLVGLVCTGALGKQHLWWAALLVPMYWVLQSIAAVKAIYQLAFRPSYWEKTAHGFASGPRPGASE